MSVIIAVDPCPAPRMTRSDAWKKRECVLRYRHFCDIIASQVGELPVPLYLAFVIKMPDSWSDKKKARMNDTPHTQRPDLDNLCKAVMDAVYKNDAHIHEIHATKHWGRKGIIYIGEWPPRI